MAQVFLIPTVPNGLAASSSGNKSQPTVATLVVAKKRKVRRYDPEEEIGALRTRLDDERTKRRELESEIYKLRQERSEMCIKMSRLEQSKIATNIPQSLVPMLTDAMAHGINPALSQSPSAPKTPAAPPRPVARATPGPGRPPNAAKVTPATAPAKTKPTPTPTASPKAAPKPMAPPTNIPISASPGQKFLIQQKTADGKVVSFLASVTANSATTTPDKAGTSSEPSTSSAPAVTATTASAEPSQPTATDAEQISPESPPPEAASANPPAQTAE